MDVAHRAVRAVACLTLVAGLVALAAIPASGAPAPSWPQSRFDAAQTADNPDETVLGTGNVGGMVTRAVAPLADTYGGAAPVVDDGMVFVTSDTLGSAPGSVQAFPASCGAPPGGLSCPPLWTGPVGTSASSVAVADGEVFVDSDNAATSPSQELWAFPEHCGRVGGDCAPRWTATIPGSDGSQAPPTVAAGTVYVPGGQAGHAYLYAFPVGCQSACQPLWRGRMDVGDVYEPAAVADGLIYVPDYDGSLLAFRVGCAGDGAVCKPAWAGHTGQLGPSGAAVAGGQVYVGSQDDDLYAFDARGCGPDRTDCPPVWKGATGGNVRSEPAVGDGLVYVTSDDGYLYAFPEHCASACPPTWRAHLSSDEDSFHSDPALADGVVYVSWTNSADQQGIDAFGATCATGDGACSPLWGGSGGSYYVLSGPVVVGGELWAVGGPADGPADLFAFGLPVPAGRPGH